MSGPSRGLKWVTGSGTHGCWLGTYERDRQQRMLEVLKQHMELNRLQNVTIYPVALSDGPDRTMNFATSINPSSGHLQGERSDDNSIAVGVTSLDRLWSQKEFPCPSVIKIDVEGAEFNVLLGGMNMLNKCWPVILLAGHGTVVQNRCCELLESWEYRVEIDRDGKIDGMYESTAWLGG